MKAEDEGGAGVSHGERRSQPGGEESASFKQPALPRPDKGRTHSLPWGWHQDIHEGICSRDPKASHLVLPPTLEMKFQHEIWRGRSNSINVFFGREIFIYEGPCFFSFSGHSSPCSYL